MDNRKRTLKAALALVAIVAIVGAGLQPASAYPRPGVTELVSVASNGRQAEYVPGLCGGLVAYSDLTPDGRYVVFKSNAYNLVPADTNAACDVFLRDRVKKQTELVSVASDGSQGTGDPRGSTQPSISANGRYVAFESWTPTLAFGDTNLTSDVFVRDRKNGTTERVSVSSSGAQATGPSRLPSISANGRYVVFSSHADNLVEHDTNRNSDAFVHDRKTDRTILASVDSKGNQADRYSFGASISGNGHLVAFITSSTNLVSNDTNDVEDVFVHDLRSGNTMRVSVASDGAQASGCLFTNCSYTSGYGGRAIGADGRYVSFSSAAQNLIPNDANRGPYSPIGTDVFVHDLKTERTERVSVNSYGGEHKFGGEYGHMSQDGRYVGFMAENSKSGEPPVVVSLLGGLTPYEVYVFDRTAGVLDWASVSVNGKESRDGIASYGGAVSNDGHLVFWSWNSDLVAEDSNDAEDYFVRDLGAALGVGGLGESSPGGEPPGDEICIENICLPPLGSVAFADELDDVDEGVTQRGANLIGGRVTHRAPLGDLYAVLELESMPRTPALAAATAGLVYGMSFEVDGSPYEIKVASTGLGLRGETTAAFGLFSCSEAEILCTKVADLEGGFGTTGERIVFSLPLDELGIQDGSEISDVIAFTAIGTLIGGPGEVLDTAKLK